MKKTIVLAVEYEDTETRQLDARYLHSETHGIYQLLRHLRGVNRVSIMNAAWFKEEMDEKREIMLRAIEGMTFAFANLEKQGAEDAST